MSLDAVQCQLLIEEEEKISLWGQEPAESMGAVVGRADTQMGSSEVSPKVSNAGTKLITNLTRSRSATFIVPPNPPFQDSRNKLAKSDSNEVKMSLSRRELKKDVKPSVTQRALSAKETREKAITKKVPPTQLAKI